MTSQKSFFSRHKYLSALGFLVVIGVVVGMVFAVILTASSGDEEESKPRTFTVDHENDVFLKDGEPFRFVAGSFHYFRALPETWREKMKTIRAGGLTAVDLYIQWSLHNPKDGEYHWDGIADVERVVQIATEEDLYVILRPGPYICAEIDNGGLPYWLATKYPNIKVRTYDEDYIREVEKWYSKLMPQFSKHFYGNGGNIIMVQLENEYGAFGACDYEYKNFVRDETYKYTDDKALLFTTDRPIGDELKCGFTEGAFATTDFGIANMSEIVYNFNKLREVQPTGPLMNTEFYTGWLTHWQEPNARRSAKDLAETLDNMLTMKANVDFYMYFGGTNFGFWAGANDWGIGSYMADITSYDYDAPMDEAGNPTEKYMMFRDVIAKHMEVPDVSTVPKKKRTNALISVDMRPVAPILETMPRSILGTRSFTSNNLWTFEELDQFSGFVLFETQLPEFTRDPANLVVTNLRDRALIYIDDEFVGALSRENYINTLPISADYGSKLSILVENQGRINFQIADDYKGILGSVRIQSFHATRETYVTLNSWTITGFPFETAEKLEHLARVFEGESDISSDGNLINGPVLFDGKFEISSTEDIYDTYWDASGWGKGFVFINGFNLGRYWPLVGPQVTMYIPAQLLHYGWNHIQIVELQKVPPNFKINFANGPIFINDEKV